MLFFHHFSYQYEQYGLYDFIKQSKNKNIFIYNKYHEIIATKILKHVNKKSRIFLAIDDASSQLSMNIDASLKEILTTSRHCKITTWIAGHIARKEIGSFLRSVIDYLIFYSTPNNKMVEQIWQEYFSRYQQYRKFENFSLDYQQYVDKDKYNGLFIDLQNKTFNFNVKYFILNE